MSGEPVRESAKTLGELKGIFLSAAARARMDAGTQRHAAHGRGVWLAGWLWRAGAALLAGGVLAGGLWWLLTVVGR